jgi:hypothetical protein
VRKKSKNPNEVKISLNNQACCKLKLPTKCEEKSKNPMKSSCLNKHICYKIQNMRKEQKPNEVKLSPTNKQSRYASNPSRHATIQAPAQHEKNEQNPMKSSFSQPTKKQICTKSKTPKM